jgi:hypothetical protein
MNTNSIKLKNLYTGEIVCVEELYLEKVDRYDDIEFIRVYKEENPTRKYLVNRLAYEVIKS